MARILTNGFELQSVTAQVEIVTASVGTGDTLAIDTSVFRGGAASIKCIAATGAGYAVASNDHIALSSGRTFYFKFDLYLNSAPSALTHIFTIGIGSTDTVRVRLNTNRTIAIYNGAAGAVGSASSAIPTGEWHRVEISLSFSGSVVAKLDGTQFASGSVTGAAVSHIRYGVGILAADGGAGSINIDNIAVNDDTGSYQNTWIGDTVVIVQVPSAAGSANDWLNTSGGAGSVTDYQLVDEIPPDNGTSLIQSNTLNQEDYFAVGASGLGNNDIINVVSLFVRFRSSTTTNSAFKVQLKKGSAGTVVQGSAITTGGTTWYTNSITPATRFPATLISYVDPDTTPWTQETLDSVQIGAIITTATSGLVQISGLYLMVDYTIVPYVTTTKTITGKASVRVGGNNKTFTSKASVLDVPALIDPTNGETGVTTPVTFLWDVPDTTGANKYIQYKLQVDKTSDAFEDIELEVNSWDDADVEVYFAGAWHSIVNDFPDGTQSPNWKDYQVRVTKALTGGNKWWRVIAYTTSLV